MDEKIADAEFVRRSQQDEFERAFAERAVFQGEVGAVEVAPPSPTVFDLDRWSLRQGREVYEQSGVLQEHVAKSECENHPHFLAADLFAAAFEPEPSFAGATVASRRRDFLEPLMESSEWRSVRRNTVLSVEMSQMAAEIVSAQFARYCVLEQQSGELGKDQTNTRAASAAAQAARETAQEVQDFRDTADALGCGTGPGEAQQYDLKELIWKFEQLKKDPQWQKIARQAGRYRSLCQSLQRTKPVHGDDELVGFELGGRLSRLAPSELGRLCDDDLGDEALLRLSQNQCLQREYTSIERQPLGPIMVCVDESSSMIGERWIQASALALTMVWLAKEQRRPIVLNTFADGPSTRRISFEPGEHDPAALANWCASRNGGGTSFDVPIRLNLKWLRGTKREWLTGPVDYVIITDGEFPIPPKNQNIFIKQCRKLNVRTTALMIGGNTNSDLGMCVDCMHVQNDLGLDTEGVQDVLSI